MRPNSEQRRSVLTWVALTGGSGIAVTLIETDAFRYTSPNGWIFEYQGLIGGALALLAASVTIGFLRRQSKLMEHPLLESEAIQFQGEFEAGVFMRATIEDIIQTFSQRLEPIEKTVESIRKNTLEFERRFAQARLAMVGPHDRSILEIRRIASEDLNRLYDLLMELDHGSSIGEDKVQDIIEVATKARACVDRWHQTALEVAAKRRDQNTEV